MFNLKIIPRWDRTHYFSILFRSLFKKHITSPRATCPGTLQRWARRDSDVVDSWPFLWTQWTKWSAPWIDFLHCCSFWTEVCKQMAQIPFDFWHDIWQLHPCQTFGSRWWLFPQPWRRRPWHAIFHFRLLRHQLRPMPMPCAQHGVQEASITPDADGWALLVSLRQYWHHLGLCKDNLAIVWSYRFKLLWF